MAIEIVSFPMTNGGSFHSYLYVYQGATWDITIKHWGIVSTIKTVGNEKG